MEKTILECPSTFHMKVSYYLNIHLRVSAFPEMCLDRELDKTKKFSPIKYVLTWSPAKVKKYQLFFEGLMIYSAAGKPA